MPKTPTPWVIDIVKNPTLVKVSLKNQSGWSNNVSKNQTLYVARSKNKDAWGHATALQTYFYNDRFTYNDPLVSYNYLLNTNTINQSSQTTWSLD